MNESSNILIVDDNPNNLQVLASILTADGFKVRPALSGEVALRAMEAQTPDLILLDIRMPGMDGYETCRQLKAQEVTRNIPVLFISALHEVEDKLQAFRVGAVDYITKPFQAEEVLARVHTHMELANTRKALAATNARLSGLMEQLVQSEKLKSLGFLAAGVAHELNTPIGNAILVADAVDTAIREFTLAQTTGSPPPSLDELVSTFQEGAPFILRNLNRASKLIGALKMVSVDRASERRRQVNIRNLLNDVVTILGNQFSKIPYSLSIDCNPEWQLETYPGHLEQILDNLIQNAIIHGFDGRASGAIQIRVHASSGGTLTLVVSDDGQGIPAANLNKVFDPFFTTKLGQGGSGLGLHIAYTLATGILGGTIGVSSQVGSGTQFTLQLPRVAPVTADDPSQAESPKASLGN